jgi:hypothetical protein
VQRNYFRKQKDFWIQKKSLLLELATGVLGGNARERQTNRKDPVAREAPAQSHGEHEPTRD